MKNYFLWPLIAAALVLSGPPGAGAATQRATTATEHTGERLVRENHCATCHQIGPGAPKPPARPALRPGPSHEYTGRRIRPDWLVSYLLKPKKLRPAVKSRMPDFRLASWEAAAIAAYFGEHRPEWPRSSTEKDNEAGVAGEKPVEFGALFPSLKSGSPAEGRKLFVMFECAKCHGDPETGSPPPEGAAKDWGPDLKEMARKLTRAGVASALFYPQKIHPGTKMPAFFYDHGEAQDKNAAAQLSDLTAYIESLKGSAPSATGSFRELRAKFRNATPLWGERLVWQFNCAGCHAGTGYAPRKSKQTAVALGYRNAPAPYSREMLVSWLMSPQTIPMHERMHAMGRMPNFGFTTREAVQIADWLFSFDGPGGRGGGGMMMMERMRKRRR